VRVVLDTNVLLSAILFTGTPGRILDAWRSGEVELVMAPDIVDEYVRVADRLEEHYAGVEIQPIIALFVQNATLVSTTFLQSPVCDDPDDDKYLACARASGTDTVVSGDKKLRAVSGYEGIRILTPRQFVDQCLAGSGRG
jgi:putative PIN family toxin of toxin-antitoxin system